MTILDVGHGVCAVLQDERGVVMFDVPYGDVPRAFLRDQSVHELDAIFISHHHVDHCGGMTGFLGDDYHVRRVFFNAPRRRETEMFERVLLALNVARKQGFNRPNPRILHFETDVEAGDVLDRDAVCITIVGPDSVASRATRELAGARRLQTDHSLCGVARIDHDGRPRVLLTGDLNDRGLFSLRDADPAALRADVLIYPHHGGASDVTDEFAFAEELGGLVQPQLIVFSLGRAVGGRPHPEVLDGLRAAVPEAHVVCTQLSRLCDDRDPLPTREISALPIAARSTKHATGCCGGSLEIMLDETSPVFEGLAAHQLFVNEDVAEPLCLKKVALRG